MARIAKADVNRALDHVAKQLKIAGGEKLRLKQSDIPWTPSWKGWWNKRPGSPRSSPVVLTRRR